MAAFDWSPGGCCCEATKGWFDYFDNQLLGRNGKVAVRHSTLRPYGATGTFGPNPISFNSADPTSGVDWFFPIDPSLNASQSPSAIGFPAFGTRWWQTEIRGTQGAFIILYDGAGNRPAEVLVWPIPPSTGEPYQDFGPTVGGFDPSILVTGRSQLNLSGACSQDLLVSYFENTFGIDGVLSGIRPEGTGLHTLNAAGEYTFQPTPNGHTRTVTSGSYSVTNRVDSMAWRNAPKACGSENSYDSGTGYTTSRLYIGNVSVSNGTLQCDGETVMSASGNVNDHSSTTFSWVCFDSSPTHWAGVILKSSALTNSLLLVVDGTVIRTHEAGDYYREVHVCHPHETLGDGWIAFSGMDYTIYPCPNHPEGVLRDPAHPWTIIVYKDGAEKWRAPGQWPVNYVPLVDWSSDRWLYVSDKTTDELPPNPPKDHFKHDGSMYFRGGSLSVDGTTTISDPHVVSPFFGKEWINVQRNGAIVQNSSAMPGTLPADFPLFTATPLTPGVILTCPSSYTPPTPVDCSVWTLCELESQLLFKQTSFDLNAFDVGQGTSETIDGNVVFDLTRHWVFENMNLSGGVIPPYTSTGPGMSLVMKDVDFLPGGVIPLDGGRPAAGLGRGSGSINVGQKMYWLPIGKFGDQSAGLDGGNRMYWDEFDQSGYHFELYLCGVVVTVTCSGGLGYVSDVKYEWQEFKGRESASDPTQRWPPSAPFRSDLTGPLTQGADPFTVYEITPGIPFPCGINLMQQLWDFAQFTPESQFMGLKRLTTLATVRGISVG